MRWSWSEKFDYVKFMGSRWSDQEDHIKLIQSIWWDQVNLNQVDWIKLTVVKAHTELDLGLSFPGIVFISFSSVGGWMLILKLMLTQPPIELELKLGLSLTILTLIMHKHINLCYIFNSLSKDGYPWLEDSLSTSHLLI